MIKVSEQKTKVNLFYAIHFVKTNIWLTFIDNEAVEYLGILFFNPE
ncbi:MAG: hypothetical protein H7239_06105 [Flavobacterium sp.]|nr:hypothetical protein [Flavobacterium sp.]